MTFLEQGFGFWHWACLIAGRLHLRPRGFHRFYSRSHDAVIRVYDEAGNVIETHEHTGDFKEP
jgi:hypothetical protein